MVDIILILYTLGMGQYWGTVLKGKKSVAMVQYHDSDSQAYFRRPPKRSVPSGYVKIGMNNGDL